ncbi:type II secretion system protein GspG, partial [bacterium]|nr:type II secretion system protein GspG [bacterium]
MVSRNKQAGFTLIEMMVVVVVIALLGAMIGPTLFKKVQQAERTRIAQDIRVVEGALKFYRLDNYRYPKQSQGLEALMTNPGGADNWNGP